VFFSGGTWADLIERLYGKKGTPKRDAHDRKEIEKIKRGYLKILKRKRGRLNE